MTTDNTPLGDRMKSYERVNKLTLPPRSYTLIRVDGRAFHTHLKGAERPFDETVMKAMDAVAKELVKGISGSVFAFVQSDECSLLVQDFTKLNTQPFCGGVEAKLVSLSAAMATAAFNKRYSREKWGLFDSRVWTMSDPVEVANYFLWRQKDAMRNSVSMAAQTWFPHKDLQGVDQEGMQEMLAGIGQRWEKLPRGFRFGRVAFKDQDESVLVANAPAFDANPHGWLAGAIPALPSLK